MTIFQGHVQAQKRDADVASVFRDFVTREKKAADLLNIAAAEADEVEASATKGVDRLRKDVETMKNELVALRSGKAKDTRKGNSILPKGRTKAP